MIVRGIFLCRPEDLDWFYAPGGASRIFPEAWEDFMKPLSPAEQKHIVQSYYKHLTSNDEVNRMAAAKAWSRWEGCCATLLPNSKIVDYFTTPHTAISLARIEAHYFINRAFLQPNQILRDIAKIADIPGVIVHGRYDMCCTADNAYALHQAWQNSELNIVPDAGHAASEPGMTNALVAATNAYGKRFNP
jgi:proline iminopeptidase